MLASSLTMIKWADNFMSESSETASPNPTPTEFTGRRGASCRENSLGYLRLLCPWNSRANVNNQGCFPGRRHRACPRTLLVWGLEKLFPNSDMKLSAHL